MKKFLTIIMATTMMLSILTGCAESDEYLEQRCEELRSEIMALQEQKVAVTVLVSPVIGSFQTTAYTSSSNGVKELFTVFLSCPQ